MRGKKTCPKCQTQTGPRAFACKKCNHEFQVKNKKRRSRKKWETCEWHELRKGQIIKVRSGSGPFWHNKEGEREMMGCYGTFMVDKLYNDGIGAYPHKNKSHSGRCFIYMGKWKYCKTTNIERYPHEIKRYIFRETN